jgi:RNA polymerase sigma-70 factor (ECF subfamily)
MAAMTSTAIEPALVEAFCRGEDEGVRAVYERFSGPVFVVVLRVLGDRELAADAMQETFVRAWRAAGRFDPSRELGPWLFTIARRVAIDTWRSRRRISPQPIEDDAVVAPPPELDSIWEAYQVRAAVDRLPPDERDVVRLCHFAQLSHVEVAARLGVPVGTVKSRSHRAHRRLAEWLRPLCTVESEPTGGPEPYPEYGDSGVHRNDL